MAARYASGDMEHGIGYDYQAISAVLVGGTAIGGGEGSALRTLAGAFIIAVVQGLLLLNGFSTQMQYLTIGVIVLERDHAADTGRAALSMLGRFVTPSRAAAPAAGRDRARARAGGLRAKAGSSTAPRRSACCSSSPPSGRSRSRSASP